MNPSPELLSRIEKNIGSKPVSWKLINKGYTQAERYVVQFENETLAFIKLATEPSTVKWLRDEYKIYSSIKADFIPKLLAWEDGDYPLLILEDLSGAHWPPPWSSAQIDKVLKTIDDVANIDSPLDLPPLSRFAPKLHGWDQIQKDPSGFLSLNVASKEWLDQALPILIKYASKANISGDSILHTDVRSDNICFRGEQIYLIDWNWAVRGNKMFDVIAWLPSLYTEGGPAPWTFGYDEPELVAALAGFHAWSAYQKEGFKGEEAIRALQLKFLKVYISWVTKIFNLPNSNPSI